MGKVWRAHHSALKRDDALKVLPVAFASDPDRLARFRREAQVLASLNHPNIAHVYGLEQADDVQALVMELVEGPTLADRIAQGPIPPSRIVFSVDPPIGNPLETNVVVGPYPAIAPDGRQLAFVVRTSTGVTQPAVRSLDDPEVRILAGTEAATSPFWSPDARTIAFFSGGPLGRIDISGGTPQVLCAAVDTAGGSWSRDGVILFTGPTGALFRIGASGGQPVSVTTLDLAQKESSHRAPWFLPDGRSFLYLAQPSNTIVLASLESPERKALVRATSKPVYSATGHLLFVRDTTTTLMAQRFDAARGELIGDAFRVADNVVGGFTGRAPFSASKNGTLVYWTGALSGLVTQPRWFDRSGKPLDRAGEERRYNGIALSPDGRKVALETFGERGPDVWVLDLARGISWSPDGRMVIYGSNGTPAAAQVPIIGIVPVTADAKAMVWLDTPFTKEEPHFSPDGRWVAYQSDESGQAEVYVQAFPGPGKKIRASSDGGGAPRRRADGRKCLPYARWHVDDRPRHSHGRTRAWPAPTRCSRHGIKS